MLTVESEVFGDHAESTDVEDVDEATNAARTESTQTAKQDGHPLLPRRLLNIIHLYLYLYPIVISFKFCEEGLYTP